jgi:hypothetical protein
LLGNVCGTDLGEFPPSIHKLAVKPWRYLFLNSLAQMHRRVNYTEAFGLRLDQLYSVEAISEKAFCGRHHYISETVYAGSWVWLCSSGVGLVIIGCFDAG